MASRKVIIDVDTGVDDAEALMLALSTENTDILAITCVRGNANVDQVCINTLKVLKICGQDKIPVYKGAHSALVQTSPYDGSYHHGADGMGGDSDHVTVDPAMVRSEHAVQVLCRMAREHKGEITLVALAPLTNIALALKMDPEFGQNLKEAVIMGGNIEGKGNITTCAEFNFAADPEAAFVTLNELKCPTKLVCWEPCLRQSADWDWFDKLHALNTPKAYFHSRISAFSVNRKKKIFKHYYSCDPTCMVVALYPESVLETQSVYCCVELTGTHTRGQMVVDYNGRIGKPANVELVLKVDQERIKSCFEKMLL